MPSFGVFEDDELVETYSTETDAEDRVYELKDSYTVGAARQSGAGTYEVKQICPRHGDHGVDDCTGEGPWADGPELLHRVLDALKR